MCMLLNIVFVALVKGLLRQLVLVPGPDATRQICPSSNPELSDLSVPPLLLDLPVVGTEADTHLTSYHGNLHKCFSWFGQRRLRWCFLHKLFAFDPSLSETGQRVSVGLERSCSESLKGELWFDPLRKGLYLCDGTAWITVLEGEKATSTFPSGDSFQLRLKIDDSLMFSHT